MWSVEWPEEAKQDLRLLPVDIAIRIVKKIEQAASNPSHFFERLTGSDYCKLRVGDYRVVALLVHTTKTISIQKVGHRKNVYE